MDSKNFCQSCGMPMGDTDEMYAKESDGSKSEDYCSYCYENGSFTSTITMEEMIEICLPHVVEANPTMTEEQAKEMLDSFLPTLKRWSAN